MKFSSKYEKIVLPNEKNNEFKNSSFSEFLFNGIRYSVKGIGNSKDASKELGLKIKNNVPIYYIEGNGGPRKGAYDSKGNVIFIFDNADEITLRHEIIHSLEYNKPIADGYSKLPFINALKKNGCMKTS